MTLVQRLIEKEEEALVECMNLYGNNLLRLAILLVKDHQTAEEVVQDTFIAAFQKIGQLDNPAKLNSWLITIMMNGCRSRMRKWSWKHVFLHQKEDTELAIMDDHQLLPDETFLLDYRNKEIHQSIQALPYKYREVVSLFYFQELTIKEIADITKEKENTIKTRLSRARGLLKEQLETRREDIG